MHRWRWLLAVLLAVVLVGAGCGGDDGGDSGGGDASDEPAEEEPEDDAEEADDSEEEDEPEGQVLLEEDFEDDADPNLWGPVSEPGLLAEIADGTLTYGFEQEPREFFGVPADSGIPILAQWPSVLDGAVPELADVRLTTTLSMGTGGLAGLTCRLADPTGQDFSSYQGFVSSGGTVGIYRTSADGIEAPERLAVVPDEDGDGETDEGEVAFEFEPDRPYEVGFSCVDTDDGGVELTVTLDGEELVSAVDDDPIETGTAGVIYSASSRVLNDQDQYEPFEIDFEDFTAVNLGEEIDEATLEEGAPDPEEVDRILVFGPPTAPDEVIDPSEEDPGFAALAEACFGGDYAQCDQLYQDTPVGSSYEAYGATCGGRLVDSHVDGGCSFIEETANLLGGNPGDIEDYGTDPALDALADACANGEFFACDDLFQQSDVGSAYEEFGATCGGRLDEPVNGGCVPD